MLSSCTYVKNLGSRAPGANTPGALPGLSRLLHQRWLIQFCEPATGVGAFFVVLHPHRDKNFVGTVFHGQFTQSLNTVLWITHNGGGYPSTPDRVRLASKCVNIVFRANHRDGN